MNYDLAIMALEGLTRAPMTVRVAGQEVLIEGEQASFKELARLCLLLGGSDVAGSDGFELQPGVHVTKESQLLRLRVSR